MTAGTNMAKKPPTDDIEALSLFAQGLALFQSYLETGNPDDLSEARQSFALASDRDPAFDMAELYRGAAAVESGDAEAAVAIFKSLNNSLQQKPKAELREDSELLDEALLNTGVQLALAHAKNQRYGDAVTKLAEMKGRVKKDDSKRYLVQAYWILFRALDGATGSPPKRQEVDSACEEADKLMEDVTRKARYIALETRFETANAAGTAYLLRGQLTQSDKDLKTAETHFLSASLLCPQSIRPLYQLAVLNMERGDRDQKQPQESYNKSKELIARSIEINPYDRLLKATMVIVESKTGDQTKAETSAARDSLSKVLQKEANLHSRLTGYVGVVEKPSTP